jgi:fatty-acyl-CoA synthase
VNIWDTLARAASLHPDRTAVVDAVPGGLRPTYRELAGRVAALATALRGLCVGRGDRVLVIEVNSLPFLELYYATAALGAVAVPVNYRLSAPEVAFIARDSGARVVALRGRFAPLLAEAAGDAPLAAALLLDDGAHPALGLPVTSYAAALATDAGAFRAERVAGDDLAHLYYTSGTTGRPRGVMLTHRNVCTHALAAIAEVGLRDADVWGHIAPMFHLADAWATFAVTWAGGRHVMVPGFEPEAALDAVARHGVTITNLVPTMLNLMVKHPRARDFDYRRLRLVMSGGAPIAPALVRAVVETFGCEYVQTYGLTETSPYLTMSLLSERLRALPVEQQLAWRAKTGRPFVAVEVEVMDERGVPVARDGQQVGEVWARGDTVTPGYWNRPEETAAAFEDGWLKTGDLAVVDEEGYLDIVDRKKDMILSGGENVYSVEVENALYQHPAVLEAAVFGVPDETWGEAVKAAVVLRAGGAATADELVAFCRGCLAAYKSPRSIDFVAALPKTGSGKILKRALRDPYWEGRKRR